VARTVDPEAYARKRAQIVAVAAVEFAARGTDGTSTARICRQAGVGSGTLFHYFATKQQLFYAVFEGDLPAVRELAARALGEPDPDAALDLLIDHFVEELTDPLAPGLAAAAYLQGNRDPKFARMLGEVDAIRQGALTVVLRRASDMPGRTLPLPVPATARWIQGLVDAAHLQPPERSRSDAAGQLRRIVDWLAGREGRTSA
jgi:AcrR family transcriptional regulator